MKPPIFVRSLTDQERRQLRTGLRSREAFTLRRSQIVLLSSTGQKLGITESTVRIWLKRFNQDGLSGLADQPCSRRPATYSAEQVSEVIDAALSDPQKLGQPFACWTLDRLATYLNEEKKIPIKRTRIDELLIAEGLRWRTQETGFGERVDPEFAKKRGSLKRSTPTRLKTVR